MLNRFWKISVWATALLLSGLLVADRALADSGRDDAAGEKRVVRKVFVSGGDGLMEIASDGLDWHAFGDHHGFAFFGGGGFLGVRLAELTPELRAHFGAPEDQGVMVSQVVPDSPAERAGILVGDIIAAVDGERIASGRALARQIRGRENGETVDLDVWRDGGFESVSVAVEERQGHPFGRKIRVLCDDGSGDCDFLHLGHDLDLDFDCAGDAPCEVRVECRDGDCTCEVNGEEADCSGLGVGRERS